jgi:hypothetical protein
MKIKISEETYKRLKGALLKEDGIVTEKVQINEEHQILEYDEFFDNVTTKLKNSKKQEPEKKSGFNTFDELIGNLRYF